MPCCLTQYYSCTLRVNILPSDICLKFSKARIWHKNWGKGHPLGYCSWVESSHLKVQDPFTSFQPQNKMNSSCRACSGSLINATGSVQQKCCAMQLTIGGRSRFSACIKTDSLVADVNSPLWYLSLGFGV